MNIAQPFIRRPIMTTLVMTAIFIFGVIAYRSLAVSDLPTIDYPHDRRRGEFARRESGHNGVGHRHAAGEAVFDHCGP